MRASLHWTQEFIRLSEAPDRIAARLTMGGIEVEGVDRPGSGNRGLLVAEVRSAQRVEGKNLLHCTVFDGERERNVVCGDTSVSAKMRVAYAPPGSLVGNVEMGVRAFGAFESEGMLCSLQDLGLEARSDEVLRLKALPGTPLDSLLDLTDEVWELNITPNRADCLSHWGVARELGAVTGVRARYPKVRLPEKGEPISATVTIDDEVGCPRYVARVIRGVRVGASPLDVRLRLERVGMRSINNVVDATNLALLELGQPLHAFDLQKLSGPGVSIRRARSGETLHTLDGVERDLDTADLVIADDSGPVALAGVMGGADTEVTRETVDILLESAYFDPVVIRKGSRRHGLHTEASHRFERGVDPAAVEQAADRCAALIVRMAGGKVEQGVVAKGPGVAAKPEIELRLHRIEKWLGIQVSASDAKTFLQRVGCDVKRSGQTLCVVPPSWRHDLEQEVDLIEEVARLYGYDAIPGGSGATPLAKVPASPRSSAGVAREWLRDMGFNELVTYSFTSPAMLTMLGLDESGDVRAKPIQLDKPLTSEQSVMRTTLLASLLESAGLNHRRGNSPLRLFDVSRAFIPGEPHSEPLHAAACAFGPWEESIWSGRARDVDFYDMKGILEGFFDRFGLVARWERTTEPFLHPGMAADVYVGEHRLGWLGRFHPRLLREMDLPVGVGFEIDLAHVQAGALKKIHAPSRYPSVMRDVAFLVKASVSAEEVAEALRTAAPDTLDSLSLFDVYESEALGTRRNLAFHLRFQSIERTLKDEEIDAAVTAMIQSVETRCGGELRA